MSIQRLAISYQLSAVSYQPSPVRRRSCGYTVLFVASLVFAASAWAQPGQRVPHIGYLYPGGGQQDSVFLVTVGGQFLQGVTDAHVSGEGVHAEVIKYYRPVKNLQKDQRDELRARFREAVRNRLDELPKGGGGMMLFGEKMTAQKLARIPAKAAPTEGVDKPKSAGGTSTPPAKPMRPVQHPLLYDLENKSLAELDHVGRLLMFPRSKRQQNAQIAEMALLEITIDHGAAPGDRELRLATPTGLTNPMCFQVGQFPEIQELEPNGPNEFSRLPKRPPMDLPLLVNGQIMPGDVDRFRFRARQGQRLVVEASARQLVPYLADAVPGWFQATIALYGAGGEEVAFKDDYLFSPDPVLFYEIPEDGVYELEIRDAIYRGREDFVYRVSLGEQPFITEMFPLGCQSGADTVASVAGWNLSGDRLRLDTRLGADGFRETAMHEGEWVSNEVRYAVDSLPECDEAEPNNRTKDAQRIDLPLVVNGRIQEPGDVDVFRFRGRAGDEVVAEVVGRRLNSPLDSLLRLTDSSGNVVEWNDDYAPKDGNLHTGTGLLTHHADSYLYARLPERGGYCIHVTDAQNHGDEAYAYRLRIGPPQPDFALRATPSSITVPAGRSVPISIHAMRKDGFSGDIKLALKDAPTGFSLSGAKIPAGRDHIRMTLTAPRQPMAKPVVLQLVGRASVNGETITRPVTPSEDMMQAFLYRHLTPSKELMLAVRGRKYPGPPIGVTGVGPVRIPKGDTAPVRLRFPKLPEINTIQLKLQEPPEGITLHDVKVVAEGGLAFLLEADGDALETGYADNLIVDVSLIKNLPRRGQKGKQKRRITIGVLPAIPFEIVEP